MKLSRIAAGICLALAFATGCSAPGATPSDPAALSASTPITGAEVAWAPAGPLLCDGQRSGDLMVWLSSSPTPPVRGDARLEAILLTDAGEPVGGATVAYDIDMTNMSHGKYLVPAGAAQDGRYAGQVHFSMPGPWRAIVTIERPDQPPVRLRFEFRVSS